VTYPLATLQVAVLAAVLLGTYAIAGFLDKRYPMHELFNRLMLRIWRPSETLHGYQHPELVEVVFQKTLAYKPSMGSLDIGNATTVLDFGGGCGLHYKQANSPVVRWAVVETPSMVARAKELATGNLRFFTDILDAVAWLGAIDVMYSNSALPYVADPERTLKQLCSIGATRMIWDRLQLSDGGIQTGIQTSNLVDNGPGKAPRDIRNKAVEYSYIRISEQTFFQAHVGYTLTERGPDWFRFLKTRV
jgi:putative methyltransferase (TIGR04325 family)